MNNPTTDPVPDTDRPFGNGRSVSGTAAASGWYMVGVLTVAYVFSFVDRSILSLMVGPIRADLGISDTAVSLLHGLAFAVFYTLLGIPIASLADRRNRRNIITAGVAFWSLATAACGFAQNFWQLFLARVGVGVGEAALSPAAYSMITDSFPQDRLGRAMAVYTMGAIAGIGIALMIGGIVIGAVAAADTTALPILGELRPWQLVFVIVGLPGLLVALWISTLREPTRRAPGTGAGPQAGGLRAFLRFVREHPRPFAAHLAGFALLGITLNVLIAWGPTHLIRNLGLTPGAAGRALGGIVLVFGTLGIVLGGWLGDRLRQRGYSDAMLRIGVISAVGIVPFAAVATAVGNATLCLLLLAPLIFFCTFAYGAAPAAIQLMSPAGIRAVASAVYLFFLNLVGMGFGPLIAAAITDHVFGDDRAVGWSVAITVSTAGALAAALLGWGLAPYRLLLARSDPKSTNHATS